MAQLVEHILGKDEVPGPNPGSSSKKTRYPSGGSSFLFWSRYHRTRIGSAENSVQKRQYARYAQSAKIHLGSTPRRNTVRIPRPKIEELALQAQVVGIFASANTRVAAPKNPESIAFRIFSFVSAGHNIICVLARNII